MRLAPVTSLNGTWKMQPETVGLDEPKSDSWVRVRVPMPWTALWLPASGIPQEMLPHRMAWFRRRVMAPPIPPLSRLLLHFDAVNFHAVVFVNETRCGEHTGDALPFDIDVTDFVTPGKKNVILVGVQDISCAEAAARRSGRRAGRKLLYPGLASHPGIWGDVSLRVVPGLHVDSVRVRTELPPASGGLGNAGGHVYAAVSVKNETGRELTFSLTNEVYDGARQALAFAPVRGTVGPGERTEIDAAAPWDSASLWWPDEPHLYTLRTALWSDLGGRPATDGSPTAGEIVDRVHTPVGFREFRIRGDTFTLNNVPIQLRSEALCPISARLFGELRSGEAVSPVNVKEARERLVALRKQQGINAVRFHRLPPSPAILDAADETGLLVIVEFPLPDDEQRYAVDDPLFWVHTEELARKWVLAHGHHPSVVMWSVDQGMVRRYGRRVAEGLRSLARCVADVDPSRPIENGGDAELVNAAELGVSTAVSVFFPSTELAFRTAGPYEPEEARGRVLPAPGPPTHPLLPVRPDRRPLSMMEHARRTLTPATLAFFLGDAAYGPGVDLAAAGAPLSMLEMAACRAARLAGIHTVGRPPAPPGATDATGELVALPADLFANFYAGTRFVEKLVLRNDTRFDQDCELICQFATGGGGGLQQNEELVLPAGAQDERTAAFELPDIRKVHDADQASSVLAEFRVEFRGARAGRFHSQRKVAIWPHVRASRDRNIGLYDPDGGTAAALSAVGAKYAASHSAPYGEFDTIVVGAHALDQGSPPDVEAIRSFVADGGLAVFLAQGRMPYDLSPVTTVLDESHAASITFVRDGEHRVLQGLSGFEMRWWQDDHRVAEGCFRKPAFGNFRCLVDAGGPGGLRWAAALEVFHGKGSYVFSQMDLVRKVARAPVAGLLLARLADAVPSWRAVDVRTLGEEETFLRIGVTCPGLAPDFTEEDLGKAQVVLLTGRNLRQLSPGQFEALRQWLEHGGCLYLHSLAPGQERTLAAITGHEVELAHSPQERLVFNRPGYGLARGLSSADLYFRDHGARRTGEVLRKMHATMVVATAKGDITGVACAEESPVEYGLLTLRRGTGRAILDQVRWDVETAADSRPARYISTLLTNLGVALEPPVTALPSSACRTVDISAACNTSLIDPVPGDGDGWTDRGPDNDLSAFSPGWIIADGVPFRVAGGRGGTGRNCCVLGPGHAAAAPPIEVGGPAGSLAFLVACEGLLSHGVPVAHFTLRYEDGLETQVPLRYGVDVLDWNERGRDLDNGSVAWKGRTLLGLPATIYVKKWENNRPGVPIGSVTFSSTRAGATPVLLAISALP